MKSSGGGVEVEVRMKWSWSWSGVVENACGGGVEVEVEIRILGTLLGILMWQELLIIMEIIMNCSLNITVFKFINNFWNFLICYWISGPGQFFDPGMKDKIN